jgi:hypothetical protein
LSYECFVISSYHHYPSPSPSPSQPTPPFQLQTDTTATGKKKGKKKKPKKNKKKSAGNTTNTAADIPKSAASADLKAALSMVEDNNVLLKSVCELCKAEQIAAHCNFLLNGGAAAEAGATSTAVTPESNGGDAAVAIAGASDVAKWQWNRDASVRESMRTRLITFNSVRAQFLNGVGGEERNVQPADDLLLENSSSHRRVHTALQLGQVCSVNVYCFRSFKENKVAI